MDGLDIKDLLKRNPHIDPEIITGRKKRAEGSAKKLRPIKRSPPSPFGKRQEGEPAWNSLDPSQRPHFRVS